MHRALLAPCLLLASSAALLACSSSSPVCTPTELLADGAETAQIVRFNEPFRWVETSFEEAKAAAPAEIAVFEGEPLPADHPAVRWLTAWLDHVDGMVREDARRELGEELRAPKPVLRLQATVSDLPASVAVASVVSLQSPRAGNEYWLAPLRLTTYPTTAPYLSIVGGATIARPASWSDPAAWSGYLETYAGVGNVAIDDDRAVFACAGESMYPSTADSGVAVDAMTPYVMISLANARGQSEDAMLATLAHELSHFYRAHGTPGAAPVYWFENAGRTSWEPPQSPTADAIDKAYRSALGEAVEDADPALVERARANEFGFMTVELQADRLADHLLRRLGLDAPATLQAFRELLDTYDTTPTKPGCLARIDEQFVTPTFEPIFPTDSFTAPTTGHPSLCYRAYDAWRQASGSTIPVGTRPDLGVGSWADAKAGL